MILRIKVLWWTLFSANAPSRPVGTKRGGEPEIQCRHGQGHKNTICQWVGASSMQNWSIAEWAPVGKITTGTFVARLKMFRADARWFEW